MSFNETSNKTMSSNVTDLSTTEDLEVVKFEVTKPFVNELSLVRAWIKNNGASVVRNLSVSFNVNGHTEDSKLISLEPDTVALVTFCWVPDKAGDYTLNVTVDANNEITESNETNNCKEECVHVHSALSWHYEQNITVENPLNCTLHDYPVLLRLDPSIFNYSEVRHNGEDISFKVGGEPIPYWVELWNTSGESRIWLLLPEIQPGKQVVKMYWNASDIPSRSSGALVFPYFEDFECKECFDWKKKCVHYSVEMPCNFSLSDDTPDNSSCSAKITAYTHSNCMGILYKNLSIQHRLEFWMRTECEQNERLRAGAIVGNVSAGDFECVFETENVTDWRLVSVNLSKFVGTNTDLGFFAANNWWNYNVSILVDNVRLRKCAEREPFVDFGLADITISNISSRYRFCYANFPNQILVNVTNEGTADARNFTVALYVRDNDNVSGVSEPQEIANETITVPHKSSRIVEFIWNPPKEGNYTLIVKADERNIVDELNETNNNMSWDVCVNSLKYWGFAFMKNVSLKPAIKNATVLLTLDPSIFDYAKVNPDGSDLRIKNDKGEDLPYWIEEWNTSGISRIWFKTDSNSSVVHLCYGNCTVNRRNETIIASFFEDWESPSLDKWLGNPPLDWWEDLRLHRSRCRDEPIEGNYSLKLSASGAESAELYRELSMNVSNAFFCADARADSVSYMLGESLSYIIDVNVSGKIYHLWYSLSNHLPEDTDDTLYFAFYPKPEGHVWHIHRNLREDLRSKGIEVPEFFNITRIALRVECKSSRYSEKSTGYFDNIAIFGMNHSVICANIGEPELNVSVENATFYANATSDMRVLVENRGEGGCKCDCSHDNMG
ncbi:MAG: putative conserved protein MJ1470 [Methanophagales archaeon]|nr:DUF2341 domain-containing protein [Methanophagales archaeon]MCU4139804.1 putative conserved protein MJ1470 [Methanophagales archaeon]